MSSPQISIENISVEFAGRLILENVTLNIHKRDFLAVIGPNGGGKSTLLRAILGLVPLKSGRVGFESENIKLNSIGYVPQNTNINLEFPITVLDVVLLGSLERNRAYFGYSSKLKKRAYSLLNELGIATLYDSKIGDLSGGERQRVFIARALMSEPSILILDEPTASIDVKGQYEIYELLKELNRTISVIVVSHDISAVLEYANSVAHVNKSLVYHEAPNVSKSDIAKRIGTTNEHICEVEILNILSQSGHSHSGDIHD